VGQVRGGANRPWCVGVGRAGTLDGLCGDLRMASRFGGRVKLDCCLLRGYARCAEKMAVCLFGPLVVCDAWVDFVVNRGVGVDLARKGRTRTNLIVQQSD